MDYLVEWLVRFFVKLATLGKTRQHKPGTPWKLLLVGYNGARNTGADARVVAMTEQLDALFGDDVQMTVMTLDGSTMKGYFPERVKLLQFRSLFFVDVYRACCNHDAAILCEGSTLKSTFANALTLFFCEAAGIMKAQGKPCLAYGSEVGAMEPFVEKLAKELCSDVYFINRTADSQKRLEKLGLHGQIGTDTAWTFDCSRADDWAEAELRRRGWDGTRRLLGVAVINPFWWPVRPSIPRLIKAVATGQRELQFQSWYFFSDSPERRRAFTRYLQAVASAVTRYSTEHNLQPVLIGMERLDADAIGRLQQMLPEKAPVFLAETCTAFEMTAVLRRLHMLVTSRYHAAVLSMAAQVPLVAVSMDERLDGLLRESMLEDYLLHVDDTLLEEHIYDTLSRADAQRTEVQQNLYQEQERGRAMMARMGQFLKVYLEERA